MNECKMERLLQFECWMEDMVFVVLFATGSSET